MNIQLISTCLVLIATVATAQTPLPLVRTDSSDPYATTSVGCGEASISQPLLSQLIRKTGVSSLFAMGAATFKANEFAQWTFGAASELRVDANHTEIHSHDATIGELARVLNEHADCLAMHLRSVE